MYNQSPRMGKPTKFGTPDSLAPNSYILCDSFTRRKNVAPFLSTTEKKFSIGLTTYTDAIYDARDEHRIKSGSSMQNRAKRFVYKADNTPGPTAYDPKIRTKKCPRLDPTPIPGKGKLYMCRVPYSEGPTGPSIPTHIDENGYDVMGGHRLVKVPADFHDRTIGPAFYDVPPESELNYKPYAGYAWSASKTKRNTFFINSNPGPGDYDVKLDYNPANPQNEEYREMARLLTFLPRYIEAKQLRTLSEDLPGPAYYDVKDSQFRMKQSLSINPVPLVCGAKRFKRTVSGNPAPGQYEANDSFMRQKQFSVKRTAFGIQSSRFSRRKIERTPGAADYQVTSHTILHRTVRKINRYSTVYAPFNKLAVRNLDLVEPDAYCKPGPGEYTVEPETELSAVDASVFKSTKIRFPEREQSNMSPASYNTTEAFNKLKNKTSHNRARVSFNARSPKCVQKLSKNPGPGEYYNPPEPPNKGYYFNLSPREALSDTDIPGPGSYTVHPAMDDSLYKAVHTHNLRLKENVLRTKLRQSPSSTYQDWMEEIKKKKKLRWFSQPTENYRHCIFAL